MTSETNPGDPQDTLAVQAAFITALARFKRADIAADLAGRPRLYFYRLRWTDIRFSTAWAIAIDPGIHEVTRGLMLSLLDVIYIPGTSVEKPNYLPRVVARLQQTLDRETARIAERQAAGDVSTLLGEQQ